MGATLWRIAWLVVALYGIWTVGAGFSALVRVLERLRYDLGRRR